MPTEQELRSELALMGAELSRRGMNARKTERYYEGRCPFPAAVVRARVTRAYEALMPMAEAAWGSLVVDSVQDRLEVTGVHSDDKRADDAAWGLWQDNAMDSESKLAHNSALIHGRSFATVWRNGGPTPEIVLDSAEQMIVRYREGSRRHRAAALRSWVDDGERRCATLYRPEALYKFAGPKNSGGFQGTQWERREVGGEPWPLPNPLGEVPVVELAVNRRLKPGSFGHARGEYEHCLGLIDRINLLTFLGLVVAVWMGFPLRGVVGATIMRDDDGKPLRPFDVDADSIFQLEGPDAKIAEFKAADRRNLSVFPETAQLAYLTKTPAHYFPLETGLSNISADTVRALEGGQAAKVTGHKGSLGEGWEEVLRLGGRQLDTPVELSPRAALDWGDHESRSLAERADAATKLKDILPWQALAKKVLNATQDDLAEWEAMRASDGLGTLLAAAAQPVAPVAPEVDLALNGNG